jgi:hypothetical protein
MSTPLLGVPDLFRLCTCYVMDAVRAGMVTGEEVKPLLGALRGRSLKDVLSKSKVAADAYACPQHAAFWRQVPAFFKKNTAFRSRDAETVARKAFMACEEKCKQTNSRLTLSDDALERAFGPDELARRSKYGDYLDRMRADLRALLGGFDDFLDELPRLVELSSGATATTPRRHSQPHRRCGVPYVVEAPKRAWKYVQILLDDWGVRPREWRDIPWNRVTFVLKNWETDRSIACEAKDALILQLAFSRHATNRLRRWGIDLRTQARNQILARKASVDGRHATIDLRNASNLVAKALALLLPFEWCRYLDDVRASLFADPLKDGVVPRSYEMLSSMGNGATFAFETMLFAAACRAIGAKTGDFLVYGDDIIVPSPLADELYGLLGYLGFEVNAEKSFSDPDLRFRESCGLDAYNGTDVTPVYVRSLPRSKPELCHLVNSLASVAPDPSLDSELGKFLSQLIVTHELPLVPWSDDTRSGIHLLPGDAVRIGALRTFKDSQRNRVKGEPMSSSVDIKPDFQVAVYDGYGPIPREVKDVGKLKGHRGKGGRLVWHIEKARSYKPEIDAKHTHGGRAESLKLAQRISDSELSQLRLPLSVVSSLYTADVVYKRLRRWYAPPNRSAPAHLYLWSDSLIHDGRFQIRSRSKKRKQTK